MYRGDGSPVPINDLVLYRPGNGALRELKAELISTYEAIKSACESSYNGVSTISKEVLEDVLFIFDDLKSALDKFMEEVNS